MRHERRLLALCDRVLAVAQQKQGVRGVVEDLHMIETDAVRGRDLRGTTVLRDKPFGICEAST